MASMVIDKHVPQLWLVRHARPLIAAGVCYGRLDVAADEVHTRERALELHAALPANIRNIQCSPLQRCQQLARELQTSRTNLATADTDVRLQEMDFGAWEGHRWDAIAREELDAWTEDFTGWRPGNGEPLQAMLARVGQALEAARRQDEDVVWITHAGVIRSVLWLVEHGERAPLAKEWTMAAPGFGEWLSLPLTSP